MTETKRVSSLLPCDPVTPVLTAKTSLRALTMFSNVSRDGDYVLAANTNRPLPGDAGMNVYLVQNQYKLQFMFELADTLTHALDNPVADAETEIFYSLTDYHGQPALPLVSGIRVAWSPDGTEMMGAGLIVALEAQRVGNGCGCEVRTVATVRTPDVVKLVTDDWRQGALLARAYFYARVHKRGLQELNPLEEEFVRRFQIV